MLKLEVVVGLLDLLEDGVTGADVAGFATTDEVLCARGLELDEFEVDGVGVVPMAEVFSIEGVGIGELELDDVVVDVVVDDLELDKAVA